MKVKATRSTNKLLVHVILIFGALFMVGPFAWMLLTSVKTFGESTLVPPVIIPAKFQWHNFKDVTAVLPFIHFYWNTVISSLSKTVGQLVFCSLAAYAFARIEFPGRNVIFVIVLSVLMVPSQINILPQYMIMKDLGWLNSLQALIVTGLFSAFGTFLLRQFFMSLPKELEEAAKLDGCNHFQIYYWIMLPMVVPGLIALSIITMLWSWNDLLWPLVVNNSPDKMPLSVGLASLQGENLTNYPVIMAGAVMAIWPMIVLFLVLQKYFVEGITLTGTKG